MRRFRVFYCNSSEAKQLIDQGILYPDIYKDECWIIYDTITKEFWADGGPPEDATLERDLSTLVLWLERLNKEKLAIQAELDSTRDMLNKYLYKD